MDFAMLFPGQGSQSVGMGADLVESFPQAREVFERADEILGMRLSEICFQGPSEKLTETRHAQPALLTHSVAVLRVLETAAARPVVVAGHSLGEYSALVAAGVLEFDSALRLVQRRGDLMFRSGLEVPGTMAAVVGSTVEQVEEACREARRLGVVGLANHNAPDQIVISGAVDAVLEAMRRLESSGARLVKRLNVSGAFHSELMQEPARALGSYLDEFEMQDARVPVVPNVTGVPETSASVLRSLLARQIASPVVWDRGMRALRSVFSGPVLEVGPGAVLKGLLRRIDAGAECTLVGDRSRLQGFLAKISTA